MSNLPPGVRTSDIPGFRPEDDPIKCPECDAEEQFPGTECTECEFEIPSLAELEEDARDAAAEQQYDWMHDEGLI